MAREMHDALGQSLTVLRLLLHRAEQSPDEAPALLREAGAVLDEMVAWSRDLMVDLHAHDLRESGLVPALTSYFERYTARTQVRVEFDCRDLPKTLPYATTAAAYRIIQEALTNVARHAGVSEATVVLRYRGGALELQICDRGQGFDPAAHEGSFGLMGMRERAVLLGGDFRLDSRSGAGTCIAVKLPATRHGRKKTT